MPIQTDPYVRNAEIVRWVDGDTVWLKVDMGYRIYGQMDFRLYGIDTPERGAINYYAAIELVNTHAPVGSKVVIKTFKNPDKYGRWLVEVITADSDLSINEHLLLAKFAVPYFGGTK